MLIGLFIEICVVSYHQLSTRSVVWYDLSTYYPNPQLSKYSGAPLRRGHHWGSEICPL